MDETRNKIPDEVIELSVQDTHFDWQPQTRHTRALRRVIGAEGYRMFSDKIFLLWLGYYKNSISLRSPFRGFLCWFSLVPL